MGEFTTNYLAKNERRILIIGQLSISGSVHFLGIPDLVRESRLLFIENLQAPTVPTSCIHTNISKQNWVVSPGGPYINVTDAWGGNVPAHPDYIPRSPVNWRAASRRVCDDFLHCRCRERIRIPATSLNPIVNPMIHCSGDNQEGPVTQ